MPADPVVAASIAGPILVGGIAGLVKFRSKKVDDITARTTALLDAYEERAAGDEARRDRDEGRLKAVEDRELACRGQVDLLQSQLSAAHQTIGQLEQRIAQLEAA